MKHIAVVTPCMLPVPATLGGAVEELITGLILDNEHHSEYMLDVFSVRDDTEDDIVLLHTTVIDIEYTDGLRLGDYIFYKIQRLLRKKEGYRLFDKRVVKAFEERLSGLEEPYSAVILENQGYIAREITRYCRRNFEFPVFFHMHNEVDIYRSREDVIELAASGVQFIAVSNYIKSQILGCSEDAMVHVLYNGTHRSEELVKKTYEKTTSEPIRFLYAGRIISDKGIIELVKAFGLFLDKLSLQDKENYHLDLIGFSGSLNKYESIVRNLSRKYAANISCIGRLSAVEMNRKYADYDIVVMPTLVQESFGMVALEAMGKGLPLIVSDSGALPEIVGDCAVIVKRNDNFVNNLADAMFGLATDKDARENLGRKAYSRSREIADFDIKNFYGNFMGIIDNRSDDAKISVIVPVYNVKDYLERCVNSLLAQTYPNTEILLIDDGSTDESGRICDRLMQTDSRIKVIHQNNMGLSGARNTGLDHATGDYVFFCDSDDYLHKNALRHMYDKLISDRADIVACGFSNVWDDHQNSGREEAVTCPNPGVWDGKHAVIEMLRSNSICTVAWNKLYKSELFSDVRFPVGVIHEDEATTYKLIYSSKIVAYTPELLYKYYQRNGSIMEGKLDERYKHLLKIHRDRIQFFKEKNEDVLEQHSRISFLENIKYFYRNVYNEQTKKELIKIYRDNISLKMAPGVMGIGKKLSLVLWKYVRY